MIRSTRIGMIAALLGLSLAATSCVAVRPWERDLLARPDMAWDEDARLATIRSHIGFSKEGSLPAGGGASGGCGCN
ncbi:MAG: DUF4266 domain-containing protein [Deltaproteobacteria bacterium]|jgi:hypothetical protein|nr:DUF4266 domain-containing protein [Deltaproteobacteria bacterium]